MGYRSEVSFTIVGKHADVIGELVSFRLQHPDADMALEECCFLKDGDDLVIKFYDSDTKWYPDYPSVRCLAKLFDHFEDAGNNNGDNFVGSFARIGENDDDTECRTFGDDPYELEQVSRRIESRYDFVEANKGKVPCLS
jgi:hypothetical protein